MKTKYWIMRASEQEKIQIKKAARKTNKSEAAFMLWSMRMTIKYRRLIKQAEALDKLAEARGDKLGMLKVVGE